MLVRKGNYCYTPLSEWHYINGLKWHGSDESKCNLYKFIKLNVIYVYSCEFDFTTKC